MEALIIAVIAAVAMLIQPAPAPADRIVLLPGLDGSVGAVTLKTSSGERVLNKAYAGAAVDIRGGIEAVTEDAATVRQRYAAALGAQPLRPVSFVVHFISGTDHLTEESRPVLDQVKIESARRPAAEIVAIGHTDRVGSDAANDALSLKRAEAVRATLLAAGVIAHIDAAGRGEREPLIATADEVAEARNRRVEINVR